MVEEIGHGNADFNQLKAISKGDHSYNRRHTLHALSPGTELLQSATLTIIVSLTSTEKANIYSPEVCSQSDRRTPYIFSNCFSILGRYYKPLAL